MTSYERRWRLNSSTVGSAVCSGLHQRNIKAPINPLWPIDPLWRKSTGARWIPFTDAEKYPCHDVSMSWWVTWAPIPPRTVVRKKNENTTVCILYETNPRWRRDMETLSTLLAFSEGNPPLKVASSRVSDVKFLCFLSRQVVEQTNKLCVVFGRHEAHVTSP